MQTKKDAETIDGSAVSTGEIWPMSTDIHAHDHTPGTSRRLDGPLLRPDQAAALLSVKTSWIYDAARRGKLPCIRVGRHIRFTRTMLEEWLEEQRA